MSTVVQIFFKNNFKTLKIGERIAKLPNILNVEEKDFYENAHISKEGVRRMIERDGNPSYDTIQGILSNYSQISPYCLS